MEGSVVMKKAVLLFTVVIILTGCSSNNELLLPYTNNGDTNEISVVENSTTSPLMAEDLAVIGLGEDDDADDVMTSSGSLLINRTTNEVIYADNVFAKLYPASITKLATAYMVLKHANLNDTVTISYSASHITEQGAKLCGFKEGDTISMKDLVNILLVYSGNDAGIAIADHIAGSEAAFSELMNQELFALGSTHTTFLNAHGLHDDDHYTTIYDIYLLFDKLMEYDEFKDMINQSSYSSTYHMADGKEIERNFASTNKYLLGTKKPPEGITVIGGKTGTTNKAGSCLSLLSQDENGNEYISVIFNAESSEALYTQMTHLLEKIK